MLIRKIIDLNAPLTKEQKEELAALKEMSDDDILYEADCPPLTDEGLMWSLYLQKKYKTRRITKEIIELEKSQMTPQQRAAYDYRVSKDIYIYELLKEYGDMTQTQLEECMKAHPYYEYYSKEAIEQRKQKKLAALNDDGEVEAAIG